MRNLAQHVRSGSGAGSDEQRFALERASAEWTLTPTALDMAKALDIGKTRRSMRVLEVACGSAVFGVTIAHRDPGSKVCLMDTAESLARARTTAENVGIENQVNWIEANPLDSVDELSKLDDEDPFDLIVVANLMHQLDAEKAKSLMADLFTRLKQEGELAIVDVFPGQEPGKFNLAAFALELNMRSAGQLRDPRELRSDMQEIGYRQIQYAQLPSEPFLYGLVLATK